MTKGAVSPNFSQLGAFEISFEMLKLARRNKKDNIFLNAGRGNPNWINTKARLAFNRLVEFGIKDSLRTIKEPDMAGYTQLKGIAQRFEAFLDPEDSRIDEFLVDALSYCRYELSCPLDGLVKELIDGALGNNYPVPSRVLTNTEIILNQYLEKVLYGDVHLSNHTQIFPTEGGTAAIVYLFNALKRNHLIQQGDKIAINTPIFTPYLQIPELAEYDLVEVFLNSDESKGWDIAPSEIDKLADPSIKALFIVNPSNPGSKAFSEAALAEIATVVQKNPNLMIITDDVYGSFVQDFKSVYAVAPENTILVYSYSKLFGATGWRIGLIAMQKKNIYDQMISKLPQKVQDELDARYAIVASSPKSLPFIDRIAADSRSVGLYHTSGLSTPQQIMEVLFSLTHLVMKDREDAYFTACESLVSLRYEDLHKALKLKGDDSTENAKYYSMVNIYQLAEQRYDADFVDYLKNNFDHLDFLVNLAEKNGVVLMDGMGFGAGDGTLRISQANLPTEDYYVIGKQILELLGEYYSDYQKNVSK